MTLEELEKTKFENLYRVGFKRLFRGKNKPFDRYYFNDKNIIYVIPRVSGIKVEPTTLIQASIDISSYVRRGNSFQYIAEYCIHDKHRYELLEIETARAENCFK